MIEIVPAIDIIDGKCVRLQQGDYSLKKIYSNSPLDVAKMFEDAGIKRLHLVDLDGAKANTIINYTTLETIATKTSLIIDFGGGVKSDENVKKAFSSGARMVTGGSIAVKDADLFTSWITTYGGGKIILGADCKNEQIAISGWETQTNENIYNFVENYISKGIHKVICTDIAKDGMLEGPSFDLYRNILAKFPTLQLIASGGVSSIDDIKKLDELGLSAVIVGKALYEDKIKLKDLEHFIV